MKGQRLAASYVNMYIGNDVVVLPVFGVPTDEEAIRVVQGLFSSKRVVPLSSRELLLGGGNIHCLSQHQPGF